MPLPNAKPDPAGSHVNRQLNSIKLGDLTNAQFDVVYDNVYLNDMSEDELRRLALVGAARQSFSASSSGPIPGNVIIVSETITYAEVGAATGYKEFYRPAEGEVYQLLAASATMSGGTVGCTIMASTGVDNITTIQTPFVQIAQESSTGAPTFDQNVVGQAIYFDNNIPMIMQAYSMQAGEQVELKALFVRVR